MVLRRSLHGIEVATPAVPNTLHRPSVDVLFQSAADLFGGRLVAAVLTGMGHDGLEGAREIKALGGTIFAQDAASCIVYGMPRAIVEADLADAIVPLKTMAPNLIQAVGAPAAPAPPLKPSPLRPFAPRMR